MATGQSTATVLEILASVYKPLQFLSPWELTKGTWSAPPSPVIAVQNGNSTLQRNSWLGQMCNATLVWSKHTWYTSSSHERPFALLRSWAQRRLRGWGFFPSPHLCNSSKTVEHCLPIIHNSTDWRQPMDSKGLVGLPNNHGWYGYGGRFLAFTPLLVYEVQVAMHPGHLVRGEVVSALIICEDKKRCGGCNLYQCTNARQISLCSCYP